MSDNGEKSSMDDGRQQGQLPKAEDVTEEQEAQQESSYLPESQQTTSSGGSGIGGYLISESQGSGFSLGSTSIESNSAGDGDGGLIPLLDGSQGSDGSVRSRAETVRSDGNGIDDPGVSRAEWFESGQEQTSAKRLRLDLGETVSPMPGSVHDVHAPLFPSPSSQQFEPPERSPSPNSFELSFDELLRYALFSASSLPEQLTRDLTFCSVADKNDGRSVLIRCYKKFEERLPDDTTYDYSTFLSFDRNGHASYVVLGEETNSCSLTDANFATEGIDMLEKLKNNTFCRGFAEKFGAMELKSHPFVRYVASGCTLFVETSETTTGNRSTLNVCRTCRKVKAQHDWKQRRSAWTEQLGKEAKSDPAQVASSSRAISIRGLTNAELRREVVLTRRRLNAARLRALKKSSATIVIDNAAEDAHLGALVAQNQPSEKELNEILDTGFKNCSSEDREYYVTAARDLFLKDVQKNKTGSRGNRFSTVTLRICLAVMNRSKKAYECMKDFLNLPSVRQLKRIRSKNFNCQAGFDHAYIAEANRKYEATNTKHDASGSALPLIKEGTLILDECKVQGRLIWSSKTGEIRGFYDMGEGSSFADLMDVFGEKDSASQEKYPAKDDDDDEPQHS